MCSRRVAGRMGWSLVVAAALAVSMTSGAAPADPDLSFGSDGIALVGENVHPWAHAVDASGRVLLVIGDGLSMPIAPTQRRIVRVDERGHVDSSLASLTSSPGYSIESIAVLPGDGFALLQSRYLHGNGEFRFTGYRADGTPLAPADSHGSAIPFFYQSGGHAGPEGQFVASRLIADPGGRLYFSVQAREGVARTHSSWIYRIGANAESVETFGRFTFSYSPYQDLALDGGGNLIALTQRMEPAFGGPTLVGPSLARFRDTTPDPAFGFGGATYRLLQDWSDGAWASGSSYEGLALTSDGGYAVVGRRIRSDGTAIQVVVAKFTSQGLVDRAFGQEGVAVVSVAPPAGSISTASVAMQPDGRIVIMATILEEDLSYLALGRLTAAGEPDTSFAPGGTATYQLDGDFNAAAVYVLPSGRILVVGTLRTASEPLGKAAVLRFNGGDLRVARTLSERRAIEYFHAGFGHYFVTADAHEIARLDEDPAHPWTRTGHAFNVWNDDASLVPACRFWSDQTFAPKSSHVYTPYAAECEKLKADPSWRFERNAFALRLPEGSAGARTCASDSRPLYRAYNKGLGGAPNHRYTADPQVLDAMIAAGWAMEGEAATRVFACVPLAMP